MKPLYLVAVFLVVAAAVAAIVVGLPRASAPDVPDAPEPPGQAAPADTASPPVGDEDATEPEDADDAARVALVGTVLDADSGAPVPGAELHTVTRETTVKGDLGAPDAVTDEQGAFRLRTPGDDARFLVCDAAGYARASHPLAADDPESLGRVDFLLQPGGAVRGRVLDATTGEGLAGLEVSAREPHGSFREQLTELPYTADTGEDGAYALTGLRLGQYQLRVNAHETGYVFGPGDRESVTLDEGGAVREVDFALERGAVVLGAVLSHEGRPVADAEVSVIPGQFLNVAFSGNDALDFESFGSLSAMTSPDGTFRVEGLRFDTEYKLMASHDAMADTTGDAFRIGVGESPMEVNLVMLPGSRVSGIALLENGDAASEAELMLMPDFARIMRGELVEPPRTTADTDGAFAFEHVPAGEFRVVRAGGNPFFGAGSDAPTVETDGLTPVEGLEVVLGSQEPGADLAGTGVIRGTVVGPDGAPVARVQVEAAMGPAATFSDRTDRDGAFEIDGLPATVFDLTVRAEEGIGEVTNVAPGAEVVLELAPPATVNGYVIGRDGGPVADVAVTLEEAAREDSGNPMAEVMQSMLGTAQDSTTSDPAGRFEFTQVMPGDYVLTARAPQGTGETEPFTVAAGQEVADVRVLLDSGVRLSGRIVDRQGQPIDGAAVRLKASRNDMADMMTSMMPPGMQESAATTTSNDEGRFELPVVPPGTYALSATHGDYARYLERGISLRDGANVRNHQVVMGEGGRAAGRFVQDGTPRAGAMVQIMGPNGMQMATTDGDGRFEIDTIPEGAYLVQVIDPAMANAAMSGDLGGFTVRPQVIDVRNGDIIDLTFGDRPGTTVTGVVTGDLKAMTTVTLRRPGGPAPSDMDPMDIQSQIEAYRYMEGNAMLGPEGTFEFNGIEPGVYVIDVTTLDVDMMNPDMNAIASLDRSPALQQEIQVGTERLQLNLNVPAAAPTAAE